MVLAAVVVPTGVAFGLLGGIPGTSTTTPTDQLVDPSRLVRMLATPFSADGNDPSVVARLGSPATPDDDLAGALDALATAPDAPSATRARSLALDILEGNPISGKTYSGIPLLNWNAPAKVKRVPAGGNVIVTVVRYGDHTLSDTWLLDFADPTRTFTLTYRVSDLDAAGVLAPTPLLVDNGKPAGGLHSVLVPLVLPDMATGTQVTNRFHPNGGDEHTRSGTQDLTVTMPPPGNTNAILTPDLRPGHTSLGSLEPVTPERLARVNASAGFSGAAPTDAQKLAAIGRIGDASPEKRIWNDLRALNPSHTGFVGDAQAAGKRDRHFALAARSRIHPVDSAAPANLPALSAILVNNEIYVSGSSLRVSPTAPILVTVVNADNFTRRVDLLQLTNRRAVYGAIDWGKFDWSRLFPGEDALTLAPGEARRVVVNPAPDAFQMLIADHDAGDQAWVPVALDRGPDRQSLRIQPDYAAPSHIVSDTRGNVWATLGGVDKVIKIAPAANLGSSKIEEFVLPGANPDFASQLPRQGPHDITIDDRGLIWVTLTDGNGIARLDPARLKPGTSDGITDYFFDQCPLCAPPFVLSPDTPPAPVPDPPSRVPEQMALARDRQGNTVVWFSELASNAIGVLRVAPDGTRLSYTDFPCACRQPKGIAVARDGAIWFTEQLNNRLGRLVFDPAQPLSIGAAHITHFNVPSGVMVNDPLPFDINHMIRTSEPHSLAFDQAGRLWFSEERTAIIGWLDLSHAVPDTSAGITEIAMPPTDFKGAAAPADLAVDRRGTVFFTDEYGDEVGTVTVAGPGPRWRPTERRSQTDRPMLDRAGNLWFTETGANLVTRITGVSAGPFEGRS